MSENRFYVFSHPKALKMVQVRLEDIAMARNPTDPFIDRPDLGDALKAQLRAVE